MRRILKIVLLLVLFVCTERFCHRQTRGFTLANIQADLPHVKEWETAEPSVEVHAILNQPFTYLARGAQAFAFESQDKKYVIKFFRHDRLRHPAWLQALPLPADLAHKRQLALEKKQEKLHRDFNSYKMAFEQLKEETGLIYLHLNQTTELKRSLVIYDRLGIRLQIDLDHTPFILQKKAELIYPTIEKWVQAGQMDQAKKGIDRLLVLLLKRCQKGIFDKDPDLMTNFGFIGEEPVQIDIGRYSPDPKRQDPAIYRDELIRITDKFKLFLLEKSPPLAVHLEESLKEIH